MDSDITPRAMWSARTKEPGLWPTLRTWMRAVIRIDARPSVAPVVDRRLQIAQMALDVAESLKFNSREVNAEVLERVRDLLDVDHATEAGK